MAGYSGTPLLQKLGIKDGHRVLLRNAPAVLPQELKSYAVQRPKRDLDVVLLFAESRAAFQAGFASLGGAIKSDGAIWVAWQKKSSGIATDLTENVIREQALKTPFVDVKVCAIDDTWSGLKLVIRKERRPAHSATNK
jgi:hypothetical protein